jgi:hypothetical protein
MSTAWVGPDGIYEYTEFMKYIQEMVDWREKPGVLTMCP